MIWLRRQVLGGYLSLVTADSRSLMMALGRAGEGAPPTRATREASPPVVLCPVQPRPPHMRDDDPLVLSGVYS